MPYLSQVAVRRVGGRRGWQLLEPLSYRDDHGPIPGRVFTAPAGYRTDWATIPRLLSWVVSKLGPWDEPSVTHDLGCDALREQWEGQQRNQQRALAGLAPLPVREPWLDARGVDLLWRRALTDVGVHPAASWALWAAVRWGALGNPARRPGWWRDAPAVIALTIPAAAATAAGALAVHLGVDRALALL